MVDCENCGAANDDKLTFCQNCGSRLTKTRPEAAAKGTGTKVSKWTDPKWDEEESATAGTSRPSAPPLVLSKNKEKEARAEDSGDGRLRCDQCGVLSPKDYRFCVGCGAILPRKREIVPQALAGIMLKSRRSVRGKGDEAKAEPAPRSSKPIELAEEAPAARGVKCSRCGSQCDAGEVFCKYCGAPLARKSRSSEAIDVDLDEAPRRDKAEPGERKEAKEPAKEKAEAKEKALEKRFPLSDPRGSEMEAEAGKEGAAAGEVIKTKRPGKIALDADEEVTGRLVVIVEDGSEGTAIELHGRQMDIGCSEGDIVLPEDRYLSPRHARLFRQDDAWYLRDLDSLNGVYRRLRKPVALRNGDLVLLGLEVLQFQLVDHAEQGLGHAVQHGVLLFGSPATQRRARLCQRTVEGVVRDVYHLVGEETTVGREIGDIVFTSDPFMSRRHAAVKWQEATQEYTLSDLSSSNGTYVAIREDARLENGDFIRLGQHLFRVDLPTGANGGARGAGRGR